MFENVQKRRNVIKSGLGVTYHLTSRFDGRNIEIRKSECRVLEIRKNMKRMYIHC